MFIFRKYNQKGFTLIELLVVVAIIGLLASVVVASLSSARAKARDARRMSDMKSFQVAFAQAKTDGKVLPVQYNHTGNPSFVAFLSPIYLSSVPKEVYPKDANSGSLYFYCNVNSQGTNNLCFNDNENYTYAIQFLTETKTQFGNPGRYCLTSQGIFPAQTMIDPITGLNFSNKCFQR